MVDWRLLAVDVGEATAATVVAWLFNRYLTEAIRRLRTALATPSSFVRRRLVGFFQRIPHLSGFDLIPPLQTLALWVLWLGRLLVLNGYVLVVMGLLPQTRPFNDLLTQSLLHSVTKIAQGFFAYLPKLVTMLVTVVATRYIAKIIGLVFEQMRRRPDELGFGWPVELIDVLGAGAVAVAWVFCAMIVAPLLPGLGTQTGQTMALLVGAMITLGSSSTVGNALSGLVLTYIRPFNVGDRIRIGEVEGDVVERTFNYVRLRTIKNEDVILPSVQIMGARMTNYTAGAAFERGLIVHVSLTIGYDVPRTVVEDLLIQAAERTEGISGQRSPFVMVLDLGDYSVEYEINATIFNPHSKATILSNLRKNILDLFGEAGIEILSPMYNAVRDGNPATGQASEAETTVSRAVKIAGVEPH